MAFDWPRFLAQHHIEFSAKVRNNITTGCPFCGDSDLDRDNMSISTVGKGWRCWRNPEQHRGRNPVRLIQALLKCSNARARELAGYSEAPNIGEQDLSATVANIFKLPEKPHLSGPLELPQDFKPLNSASVMARPFQDYLRERQFSSEEIAWLAGNYNLRYATRGAFAYRIIIPVTDSRGRVMTWTARTIVPEEEVRYKTLHEAMPPSKLLLGLPLLWNCDNPRLLVVCEGPFDAMRITVAGWQHGVYGTCLFGLNLEEEQIDLLEQLRTRFQQLCLVLDPDAELRMFGMTQRLSKCRSVRLPPGYKDPGDLPPIVAGRFVEQLLAGSNSPRFA